MATIRIETTIGQQYVRRGTRLFAVPKQLGLADRIACRSNVRGNWDRVMVEHKTARVINNIARR